MKSLALVALAIAVLSLSGCGGPSCDDPSLRSDFMQGCSSGGTAPAGFCSCAYRELADTHSCEQLERGDITWSAMNDAAEACY